MSRPAQRLRAAVQVLRLLLVLAVLRVLARRTAPPRRPAPKPASASASAGPSDVLGPDVAGPLVGAGPSRFVQGLRLLLVLVGVALLARAGFLFLNTIKRSQWPEIAVWLAAGVVLHDALIAPITLLLARIVHPGPVLRAGWLGAGVCVILTIPLLEGAMRRRNPTVIPHAPGPELLRALAVVVLGMLLATGIARLRGRRAVVASA